MNKENGKEYDLESRTLSFAKDIRDFIRSVPKTLSNLEYSKQLIRSSSSVGANYIEANESISKKDLGFRIKISRKEAKESRFWLELIEVDKTKLSP
ncbi:MAG: four helix bundle protein [bacterium]|nr:four helix bundle protein [bacterium]